MSTPSSQSASFRSFWQLGWREQLGIAWVVFRLQVQIIFSQRLIWFLGAGLLYLTVLYVVNYQVPVYNRFEQKDIYISVLIMPLLVLALYLNMQVIVGEKEQRTLEVMFTTAGSRYKVWLVRLGSLNFLLFLMTLAMSLIAFFTFADLPIIGMACNVYVTIFFVGNLTLYFAVRLRSGLGAGMATGLLLILHLLSSGIFHYAETRYFLFFNPYDIPREMDPQIWGIWMWQNRIGFLIFGLSMLFFAIRGMENRDRLLR